MKKVVLLILLSINFSLHSQVGKSDEEKGRIVESRLKKIDQREKVLRTINLLELKKEELFKDTEISKDDYKVIVGDIESKVKQYRAIESKLNSEIKLLDEFIIELDNKEYIKPLINSKNKQNEAS